LIFIWAFVFGGPIPILKIRAFSPSADLDSFEESMEKKKELDDLWERGVIAEDPKIGKLRSDVLSSLDQYRSEPCNKKYKESYIDSVVDFIENRMDRMSDSRRTSSDSVEVIDVGGDEYVDGSMKFDQEAMQAIIGSVEDGLLEKEDIPSKMSILVAAGIEGAGGVENIYKACAEN
jgi:hypothetical protein